MDAEISFMAVEKNKTPKDPNFHKGEVKFQWGR